MRESWQGGLRLKVRPAVQHSASSGFIAPCRCSGISLLSWPWGSAALQTISALQTQRVCGSGDAFHPPWVPALEGSHRLSQPCVLLGSASTDLQIHVKALLN